MRPSFHPRLINDPLSDPGLFIPFLFEKRALMFDLGEIRPLSSKDLLKLTHVFVTHTHMDHFIGFDSLLRIFLGRDKNLHLFGPPCFFDRVEGKLAGYTWNLVDEYQDDFRLKVTEVHPDRIITREYCCQKQFMPSDKDRIEPFFRVLFHEPAFHVEAMLLDHRVPCLAFSLVENYYVHIIKEGLRELGLDVGPWLNRFKKAIYEKRPLQGDFIVTWEERGMTIREKKFILGELTDKIARIAPGQKITYITDVSGSPENKKKITQLAQDADHLFIEAAFLDRDKAIAQKKFHLTAKEAGELAREAAVKELTLFHFSPRYSRMVEAIEKEAMAAFHA
ncbi:MAG: ribonuclease Z [Deltaproteobacteria bacterium]|nr:ribonuclease Z [Deltaproteobacteria bacterium]